MSFRRRTNEALAQLQQQVADLGTKAQPAVPAPPGESSFDAPTPGTSLADLSEMIHTWPVGWTGWTSGSAATTSW